ncbi:efflux RND transporter periplasmic adaptor subunit [Sedimentibacter hydroxybenzoicus DSM 7310]|uniref:Efflux RND transporter periplasmic adaptor subunit n=1 Tax=Sedimentibacter hydroxybenzoicus DSM 7310 TaxID=1123245 RepID=A0A974BKX9_SEDHY|nr:efflux RND transporter periplasmic adaptor subunit [Sedimentibacter hydroxybenzoicus]NYB75240.1 efflux RND transporter periplasmic adaptor subunit [Sedimentibacter hydroxybenzoicus DSM 7310]
MKNLILSHKKTAAAVIVLVVLVIAITVFAQRKKSIEDMRAADTMVTLNRTDEIEAWGEVMYSRIENISIDFPSTVTDVQVKEGERVTLNQSLVIIDLTEYNGSIEKLNKQMIANQLALDSAPQDISALQADITRIRDEIARKTGEYNNDTAADIKLLQNSMELALKELEDAKIDFQDYQSLYNEGAVSKTILNQYETMLNQRQKAVDDLEASIHKTKTALKDELNMLDISLKSKQIQLSQLQDGNSTNVAMQESSVSSTEVDLNIMKGKLEKGYIKDNQIVSNVKNGIIKNIAVINGNRLGVQGVPTSILQIIDVDSITVSAEVYEEFIGSVHVGDIVEIVPALSPDISLEGTVTHIPALAVEKDGRRVVRVIIDPDDPNNILKPGFTADVYFQR